MTWKYSNRFCSKLPSIFVGRLCHKPSYPPSRKRRGRVIGWRRCSFHVRLCQYTITCGKALPPLWWVENSSLWHHESVYFVCTSCHIMAFCALLCLDHFVSVSFSSFSSFRLVAVIISHRAMYKTNPYTHTHAHMCVNNRSNALTHAHNRRLV